MPSYTQYKRQVADASEADIESWITVKGNHIPIMKGQSKEEAVKAFIEKKGGESGGGTLIDKRNLPVGVKWSPTDIYGNGTIGGVIGSSDRSKVANCYIEGSIELDENAKIVKVGGVIGAMGSTLSDSVYALVSNNVVSIEAIKFPTNAELYVHRIVGYSNGDTFEYDWKNIDYEKPQSEWPRFYNDTEKCLKDNYVVSELAAIDVTIELNDTTTEGATMERSLLTAEWLAEHDFAFGETIASPWQYEEGELYLWFEKPVEETAVDNVKEDLDVIVWFEGDELVADGEIYLFDVNGRLMLHGDNRINVVGLPAGVYVVRMHHASSKIVIR